MDSSPADPKSAADYIHLLNDCDAKIVSLLRVHADAVKALGASEETQKFGAQQRRAILQGKVALFIKTLGEIRETQHTAIQALRETASGESGRPGSSSVPLKGVMGDLGELDVSFLNSQNDDVGKQVEAEQWAKAAEVMNKLVAEKSNN